MSTLALPYPTKPAVDAGALFYVAIRFPQPHLSWTSPSAHSEDGRFTGDVALFCVAAPSLPALFVAPVANR